MSLQAALYHIRDRRRGNSPLNTKTIKDLIASPASVEAVPVGTNFPSSVTGLVFPTAWYGISHSAGLSAGEFVFNANGRSIGIPDLAADEKRQIGYIYSGPFSFDCDAVGDLSLYILDDWKRFYKLLNVGYV